MFDRLAVFTRCWFSSAGQLTMMVFLLAGCSKPQLVVSSSASKELTQEEIDEKRIQLQNSDFGRAKMVAEAVVKNLGNQHFGALQSGASEAFQTRYPVDKLETLGTEISRHALHHRDFRETGESEIGKTHTLLSFSTDLVSDQGKKRLTLVIVKTDFYWQLDDLKWESISP